MAKQPYIPLYIGDWEQDTNCLSLQAEAAWLKIIFKMFKGDKTGVYKISTKALQNLWKCDTKDVQNILDELLENNIGGIEKGEIVKFINRRMVKEAEISEIRTNAVQNRYKTPTKHIQNTDIEYDNEIDNEIENDTIKAGNIFFELTELENKNSIEYIDRTAQKKYTSTELINLFAAFKIQYEKELYPNRAKLIQHFRNWLKQQKNGQQHNSTGHKAIGADLKYDRP